jgi:hypothetical protein
MYGAGALAVGVAEQPAAQGGVVVELFHDVSVHRFLLAFDMRIMHPCFQALKREILTSGMQKSNAKSQPRLPSLDLLKGFEAAARNLSFTKAAAELFVTQSAISRQVKTLEEQKKSTDDAISGVQISFSLTSAGAGLPHPERTATRNGRLRRPFPSPGRIGRRHHDEELWSLPAATALLLLGSCVTHNFAPGPGMAASDFEPESARCRLFARGADPGFAFGAVGSPQFVGGAMAGAARHGRRARRAAARPCAPPAH